MRVIYPTFCFLYSYLEKQLFKKANEGYRLTKIVGWCYYFETNNGQLWDCFFYNSSSFGKFTGSEDLGAQVQVAYASPKRQQYYCGFTNLVVFDREKVDEKIDDYRMERNKRCIWYSLEWGFAIMFLCLFPIYQMILSRIVSFYAILALLLGCLQILNISLNIIQFIKRKK